jgi:hypothetical protein
MVRGFQAAHSQTAAAVQQQAEALSPFVVTLTQMVAAPELQFAVLSGFTSGQT